MCGKIHQATFGIQEQLPSGIHFLFHEKWGLIEGGKPWIPFGKVALGDSNSKGQIPGGYLQGIGIHGLHWALPGFQQGHLESSGFGISPGCSPREGKPRHVPELWNLPQDPWIDVRVRAGQGWNFYTFPL